MTTRNGRELLSAQIEGGNLVCAGFDPRLDKMPLHLVEHLHTGDLEGQVEAVKQWCVELADALGDVVGTIKLNIAFFARFGWRGIKVYEEVVAYIHAVAPNVFVIGDLKRGDIDATNEGYLAEAEILGLDGVTVNSYLGPASLGPLLKQSRIVLFVLCRTSNVGAEAIQDRMVRIFRPDAAFPVEMPAYLDVAEQFSAAQANSQALLGLVTGATAPEQIGKIREKVLPSMPFLIPGYGEQGGHLEKSLRGANRICVINNSRALTMSTRERNFAAVTRARAIDMDRAIRAVPAA